MPEQTVQTEQEAPLPETEEDEYLTEEEEAALEEESRRRMSRLARRCLELAVLMLGLAGLFLLLEAKHLSVLYTLPPYTLPLSCVAVSFFAMMTGLFSLRRNAFAMLVMVMGGWMVLFVLAMGYLQEPETIVRELPGTQQSARLTLVSSPISASLYIEEPILENLLSRRWKFPVHGKNIPLDELIVLKEAEDGTVELAYEGRIWAVYDPDSGSWADVLSHEEQEEEDVEDSGKKE